MPKAVAARPVSIVQPRGVCAGSRVDPDLFFSDDIEDLIEAQELCAHCPMLAACAGWARTQKLTDGVFATVVMPTAGSAPARFSAARRELARIAAGGKPKKDEPRKVVPAAWRNEQVQAEVHELRAEGLGFDLIAARLHLSSSTARRAHAAYLVGGAA
ncbi:WhiB family transcriptional regulator [Nocardia sp. NPDC003693]